MVRLDSPQVEPEQAFLEYIIKAVVDYPGDVAITRSVDPQGILLTLTVHPKDMAKIIGTEGRFATGAIRPFLHAFGIKRGVRVSVKIDEPIGGKKELSQ